MASKRRSVCSVLEYLGHRGDRHDIIERVFESASRVTVRSDGEPVDGGDFLVEVFESLGTTKDWPVCGSREWVRLREIALRRVVARLAREGLLDAITGTGARAPSDEDAAPVWINTKVAAAMLRRVDRNPEGWSKCVKRDTPLRVIMRWSSEVCPDVPEEMLAALAHDLRRVPWVDEDGHILGSVMLRALEAELEAGRDEKRWMLVVSDFHAAIDALRGVLERLSLL